MKNLSNNCNTRSFNDQIDFVFIIMRNIIKIILLMYKFKKSFQFLDRYFYDWLRSCLLFYAWKSVVITMSRETFIYIV